MEQYIPKSALVAEIEKLYNGEIDTYTRNILDRLKSNIDTLEVKEVDLEKEIDDIFQKYKNGYNGLLICKKSDFSFIAKYFFELGLKTQKGEEV